MVLFGPIIVFLLVVAMVAIFVYWIIKGGDIVEFGNIFYDWWAEILAFLFLIIGFIIAALARSAFVSYLLIFFSGLVSGRMWYLNRKNLKFPLFLTTLGFLIGFMIGSFYGDNKIIFLCFLIGNILSHYVHKEGYVNW